MANSENDKSNSSDRTSSPELNPLQNPTLGRNLGRWAQVYFTNHPEKREEAVVELLRELEKGVATVPDRGSNEKPDGSGLSCPVCQQKSDPGRRFCGLCGSSLTAPSEAHRHDRTFVINNPVPSFAPISPQGDAQWLRDKVFASFDSCVPRRKAWKYLLPVFVLALVGVGYFSWSSRSNRIAATNPDSPAISEPSVAAQKIEEPKIASNPSPATPADSASAKTPLSKPSTKPAKSVSPNRNAQPATLAVQRQRLSPEPASETAPGSGERELLLARHYLDGKGGTRDTSEAAKWLWKAVGKQNTSASMLLADMYIRGDGVSQSCDQARLLLSAAAKRGSHEAAAKLHTLELNSCS